MRNIKFAAIPLALLAALALPACAPAPETEDEEAIEEDYIIEDPVEDSSEEEDTDFTPSEDVPDSHPGDESSLSARGNSSDDEAIAETLIEDDYNLEGSDTTDDSDSLLTIIDGNQNEASQQQ